MSNLVIQPDAAHGFNTLLTNGASADLNISTTSPISIGTRSLGKSGSNYNRLLIRFDTSAIPAGAVVNSAQLTLLHSGGAISTSTLFQCNRLTQTAWLASQATWNSYSTGNHWTTPGGDYTTASQSTITLTAANVDLVFTGLETLVIDAIANRGNLLHLVIIGPESGSADHYLYCSTSSDSNPGNWPKLLVNYSPLPTPLPIARMCGNMQELLANLGG